MSTLTLRAPPISKPRQSAENPPVPVEMMRALRSATNRNVTINAVNYGKPDVFRGRLLEVRDFMFVTLKTTNKQEGRKVSFEGSVPFVGHGFAIKSITANDIILYENPLILNDYREEALHNIQHLAVKSFGFKAMAEAEEKHQRGLHAELLRITTTA
jgi:hypothetical protein